MKRIIALILAVLMIGAVLAACGDSKDENRTVKTSVSQKYDDGYAKNYVDSDKIKTDNDGNTTYEFTGKKYDEYVTDHSNVVSGEISSVIKNDMGEDFGQYSYVSVEKKAVIIGVNPGKYDAAKAEAAAGSYAESAFKVFMALENPVSTIKVLYVNANNQDEVYGTFEKSAK